MFGGCLRAATPKRFGCFFFFFFFFGCLGGIPIASRAILPRHFEFIKCKKKKKNKNEKMFDCLFITWLLRSFLLPSQDVAGDDGTSTWRAAVFAAGAAPTLRSLLLILIWPLLYLISV